ncbi:nuclear transport factor 2 family protein [Halosolutus halophilus]|uniref:nuclear transport factor 2 family protein n=1 Tax=Halosolutus halophilus TaxID=1552990 RepID=UPI00223519A1|nr:nuclear transport factor 2 family protein [Halosolutus halophilus]
MKEVEDPAAALTVSNLAHCYMLRMDKHDVDGVLELMTDDCVLDYGDFGRYDGKDELRGFLEGYVEGETGILDSFHLAINPWITVDGDTATGRWHFLDLGHVEDMGAAWLAGFYTIDFTKEGNEWLINKLTYEAKYFSPYDDGWAETPMAI